MYTYDAVGNLETIPNLLGGLTRIDCDTVNRLTDQRQPKRGRFA